MSSLTVDCEFHVARCAHGRKVLQKGPRRVTESPSGRIPRVARLMALAVHFDGLIRAGKVRDYAEIARLGHVSRARVTQIMNLLLLAPDIQEELLFLPEIERGREQIHLRQLQPIAAVVDWTQQRRMWVTLRIGS